MNTQVCQIQILRKIKLPHPTTKAYFRPYHCSVTGNWICMRLFPAGNRPPTRSVWAEQSILVSVETCSKPKQSKLPYWCLVFETHSCLFETVILWFTLLSVLCLHCKKLWSILGCSTRTPCTNQFYWTLVQPATVVLSAGLITVNTLVYCKHTSLL